MNAQPIPIADEQQPVYGPARATRACDQTGIGPDTASATARPRIETAHRVARWVARRRYRTIQIGVIPALMVRVSLLLLWALIILLSWMPAAHGEEESESDSMLDMSIEELLNVEITSVSKRVEKRSEAAAAVYVLTSEDIRRSSATNIPDLLRTVPGIEVAQNSSNRWSVTARGFAGRFANKLLVLIDGRTIYTPFFSGVYWETKDVMLEDVDRIEIIRGPGGALWGANAVNGVINIVTKKAQDTQGGLLAAGGGTEEQAFGALRYGGEVGDLGYYRVYGKSFSRDEGGDLLDNTYTIGGGDATDDWQMTQVGFRMDLAPAPEDEITIQGDAYLNYSDITQDLTFITDGSVRRINSVSEYTGGNLLTRWTRTLSDTSDLQLQAYWDYYGTDEFTTNEKRHTFDLDFQHRIAPGGRQEIVWGLGYRLTVDNFENTLFVSMTPHSRADQVFSAFVQDQIDVTDTLRLTLGTKIEHNDFTGFEIQPSARFAWTPSERHTVWGAVSRAVRTPSRSDHDLRLVLFPSTTSPGDTVTVFGNRDFDAEELLAFELGYRVVLTDRLAVDIATFYNDYDYLRYSRIGLPVMLTEPVPHTTVPLTFVNGASANTYGIEIAADLQVHPWWLLRGSYSFLEMDVKNPQIGNVSEGESPEHQFSLQSRMDLPHNMELDTTLRYVSRLADINIDGYVTADVRWAWHPCEDLEFAIVGRNLIEQQHYEFFDLIGPTVPSAIQRGVYAKVTWKF